VTSSAGYVLDANVFIEAHKRYYAFDLCPGYWAALLSHHHAGRLCSIGKVRDELVGKGDALSDWVQGLPDSFFVETADPSISALFSSVITWVQAQPQYHPGAKAAFAAGADGWLVAYAKAQNLIVATDEIPKPDIKRRVPIPNVCDAFGVDYVDTFKLLRTLGVSFILTGGKP
jgi:hypothetical protein